MSPGQKQSLWSFSQGKENTQSTLFTANCYIHVQHQETHTLLYSLGTPGDGWGSGWGIAERMKGQPPTLNWWATFSSSRWLFCFC